MWRPLTRCFSAGGVASYIGVHKRQYKRSGARSWVRHCIVVQRGACPSNCEDRWGGFHAEFRGQVTPSRLLSVLECKETLPVEFHGGPFKSRWLRVRAGASIDHVRMALEETEPGAETAIYVGIPDDHAQCGPIVSTLRARGFRFHHFHEGASSDLIAPSGELIYYRWDGKTVDMVPSYRTACEGIGVLVFSPKKDEVLLVWEYGHWKVITGSVEASHSMTGTVRKEVREEVGLELEDGMWLVGGWQEAKARDLCVNSVFLNFAAVAKSYKFQVDNVEISEARWFPLSVLPTLEDERRAPKIEGKPHTLEVDLGVPGRNHLSRTVAHFLDVHRQSRGLQVHDKELNRDLFF